MTSKANGAGARTADSTSFPRAEPSQTGSPAEAAPSMRLQKFLARAGVASRRASEALIMDGRVTVNGTIVAELGTKVSLADLVVVDGREVRLPESHVTIMLHKPAGVVTSMKAQAGQSIVADLVPTDRYPGLYPIGRLDSDTTGLLLFSTDGELGHALLHPSRHVPKTYVAWTRGKLSNAEANRLRKGVMLEDGLTQPAEVEFVGGNRSHVRMTIHEGRKRQVKRMFEAVGHPVSRLHRERFGPLELDGLKPGQWRELTDRETDELLRSSW